MNSSGKKKILVLVEGEKTDAALMDRLFHIYPELDAKYQIVSYSTNIYVLYQAMFRDKTDVETLDLLQVLKEREKREEQRKLFDDKYTDILLIFDLDPHDAMFSKEKIQTMQQYFTESSDMGKLYLSYPMIEAFYHMRTIPDADFINRTVSKEELDNKSYKERVRMETKGHDYRKFITSRDECSTVITQNVEKALQLLDTPMEAGKWQEIDMLLLLGKQLAFWDNAYLHVLCTCGLFIYDFDHKLLYS